MTIVGHVAAPLYDKLGPEHFRVVADWLRDVASDFALETENPNKIHPPSVAWLAEAVTFYEPSDTEEEA